MSAIRSSTGLASGLDIGALAESLVLRQRATVARFESRADDFRQKQNAIGLLEANVLALQTSGTVLSDEKLFDARSVSNSNEAAVAVTADDDTPIGSLDIRSVQLASSHSELSRGFASPETVLPPGQVVIRRGGRVAEPTRLELLNGGAGVGGGTIRLTDRSGDSAVIDLSDAVTLGDVARKVDESGLDLSLSAHDDRLRLTATGSGAGSIVVEDITGQAAAELGLAGTSATDRLDGSSIFMVTEAFTFAFLNDGNEPLTLVDGAGNPDLLITATDGSTFEVVLDEAETLADVVAAINTADDNLGSVTAAVVNGRLELTDTAGGGGTVSADDVGNSRVVRSLGLDTAAAGSVLTGRRLHGGLNSVLLASLNGGAGIDTPGTIEIVNSAGETASIDLSAAETLSEVVDAINDAVTGAATPLNVRAEIDEAGTGLRLVDVAGGAGSLAVTDTTGTTAADLGIGQTAASGTIDGGPLDLRTVSEATSLSDYSPSGSGPAAGLFQITDSLGNTSAIRVNSAVNSVGALISRINADATISVQAELNETGDGFVLIDTAGGAGTLAVEEIDSTTAADLRLLGEVVTGADGRQRIVSRDAVVVDLDGTQTLSDLAAAINEQTAHASAELLDDGSRLSSTRLQLASAQTGLAGQLVIESTIDLGLRTTSRAADAVARVGTDAATSFLVTSETNQFEDLAGGVDFELLAVSDEVARVRVSNDYGSLRAGLESFVTGYNALMSSIDTATSFSVETNQRGVLQGDGFTLRIEQRVQELFIGRSGPDLDLRSLTGLGITAGETGQLSFDADVFDELIESDPDAVERFLTDEDRGFGTKVESLVTRLTDTVTGVFKTEKDGLQASIDAITVRVEEMNELLEIRQERLYREFVRMEEIVAGLQGQQQAVAALTGGGGGGG